MLFGNVVFGQEVCFPFNDAQRIFRELEERGIYQDELAVCNDRVNNLEREKALIDKTEFVNAKLLELAEKERDLYKDAYEREKQIATDALKLVKNTEKRSIWVTIGTILLGISAVVLAFVH